VNEHKNEQNIPAKFYISNICCATWTERRKIRESTFGFMGIFGRFAKAVYLVSADRMWYNKA
jgi:hypothetical protein